MNKPVIFTDCDGVLTKGQKLYWTTQKSPEMKIDWSPIPDTKPQLPEDGYPWTPMPGPNPWYPGTICGDLPGYGQYDDAYEYEHFDPVQNQEDWENAGSLTIKGSEDKPINYLHVYTEQLHVAKMYSDKDSHIMSRAKKLDNCRIIVISRDKRVNLEWCNRQGAEFIHCAEQDNKYEMIRKWLLDNGYGENEYTYIGDALPDLESLKHAQYGFVVKDAAASLMLAIVKLGEHKIQALACVGGDGALDEVYTTLVWRGVIKDEDIS